MARHLPDPAGTPSPEAARIIEAIEAYLRSDADPLAITTGLRHVQYVAELAWDESVTQAKWWPDGSPRHTFAEIQAATGDALGTLQGRIRLHRARVTATRSDPRRKT